jgi:RNA polymerase sigma-B factor
MKTAAEEQQLMRRHRGGDARAREQMIERNLPLARRLALRYRRSPEPLEDLFQVAALGLVKAVDRWDPDRGLPFPAFAVPTILGELRRHFRDTTWNVRPPRDLQELSLAVDEARGATNEREPTVAELARRLGRPPEQIIEALQASEGRSAHSLDTQVNDDEHDATTVGDLIGRIDYEYERVEARATIERLTAILDQRSREILRLRFENDLLQSEIAERVGISQMHVSRILRSSLERLSLYGRAAAVEPAK